jgi:methionyl-tRNA synthetase
MPPKFYLTTPIYYVNARPHIGHAYTTIVADVVARRRRLLGDDTFFLTGTDEHGQKIERAAAAAGIPPQAFADEVSAAFEALWRRMGITNNAFIRTTDPRHRHGVQKLFADLYARGFIELRTYTGQYCVSEETFVDGPPGTIGPDGKPTETVSEENFFFKLSAFQLPLIDLIESNTLEIQPESRRNEVLSFLRGNTLAASLLDAVILSEARSAESKDPENAATTTTSGTFPTLNIQHTALGNPYIPGALKDLSISRSSFTWGIPVPEPAASQAKERHVIYVWLDALANYLTAIGYGSEAPADIAHFARYWPADLHLVGKEIIRFHCVYWPAFLMALRPPEVPEAEWNAKWLPKKIVAHGWLLFEESKMSKSRGNIVRTETILDAFGTLCPPTPTTPPTPTAPPWDSTGLQPGELGPQEAGALAPGTISPLPSHNIVILSEGASAPPPNVVILSEGASAPQSKDLPDADTATAARTVPPPSPTSAPTKAHQDLFAADILRYFLLREVPFGQDGAFSFDALVTRYNADLANGYGNLVSRTFSLIQQNQNGAIIAAVEPWLCQSERSFEVENGREIPKESIGGTQTIIGLIRQLASGSESIRDFYVPDLTSIIALKIGLVDGYLSANAPWKLAKSDDSTDRQKMDEVLYTAAESIRIITALLYPIMPYATASVWRQLGLGSIEEAAASGKLANLKWGDLQHGTKLGPRATLFPSIKKEDIPRFIQMMTDIESAPPVTQDPTNPAAPPRTSSFSEPNPGAHVGASSADCPELFKTPTHSESPASGPFATASAASSAPDTPQISIDDFVKVDLRVARILVAERVPKADKLLRLEVDLGPAFTPSTRQVLAGIAEHYAPETLIGRKVVIVANLAPRKMRGLESQGMLVAASLGEHGRPVLAGFLEDVEIGSRLK